MTQIPDLAPNVSADRTASDDIAASQPAAAAALAAGPTTGEDAAATPLPRHVAIIMDGNGRWAGARGLPRWAGHRAGIASVRRTVEEARRRGIRHLTLYAFSTENWRRPSVEVSSLWELLSRFLVCERAEMREKGIRLVGIGRRDRLPLGPRTALELTERLTAGGQELLLRLAIDYGSQWAIADAARRLAHRLAHRLADAPRRGDSRSQDLNEDLNEAAIQAELLRAPAGWPARDEEAETGEAADLLPPPDLLIRTGGEIRLSNFMLWECAYSELWFTPTLWPDFQRETFAAALADFARRRRRFGAAEDSPAAPAPVAVASASSAAVAPAAVAATAPPELVKELVASVQG